MHARLAVARRELPRAVRIAVAAALAWWIARLLGADRPVFAVIVPMVAIRDDTHAALSLSLGRMLGVMAGVVLGIAVVAGRRLDLRDRPPALAGLAMGSSCAPAPSSTRRSRSRRCSSWS